MEAKEARKLSIACFETGRYFVGELKYRGDQMREALHDAVELRIEVSIDPKDTEPDPNKKARLVHFNMLPAVHPILTIGNRETVRPQIRCGTAIAIIELDRLLDPGVVEPITKEFNNFWDKATARLLPPKEPGSVITPKKKLIVP